MTKSAFGGEKEGAENDTEACFLRFIEINVVTLRRKSTIKTLKQRNPC
jgi:hypothetical protein